MGKINKKGKLYSITTISKSGQIVICKKIREELEIESGQELLVYIDNKKSLNFFKIENLESIAKIILKNSK